MNLIVLLPHFRHYPIQSFIYSTLPLTFSSKFSPCHVSTKPYSSKNTLGASKISSSINISLKVPTVTASQQPPTTNTHPMLTHSKIGHSKPIVFLANSSIIFEPLSYKLLKLLSGKRL